MSKTKTIIVATFTFSSTSAFNLDPGKILSFSNELTLYRTILTFNDPEKEGF